jgi:nucleoside-diphosphate-sugar epimerase
MRVFLTGGSGVIGRAAVPLLRAAGHTVEAPGRTELDLFDPAAVGAAVDGAEAVVHLATRIGSWPENDRLRTDATRLLVDAALAGGAELYVQASIAFLDPESEIHRSAVVAEREAARFAEAGRRGVVLRFGFLDGPGTGNDEPNPIFGSTLQVEDAGRALVEALTLPSGTYVFSRER